jgi:hypothetical protein
VKSSDCRLALNRDELIPSVAADGEGDVAEDDGGEMEDHCTLLDVWCRREDLQTIRPDLVSVE